MGANEKADSNLILIGSNTTTNSSNSVIISPTGGTFNAMDGIVVIGSDATVTSGEATAVGYGASAGQGSAAFGFDATATISSLAMGSGSDAGRKIRPISLSQSAPMRRQPVTTRWRWVM